MTEDRDKSLRMELMDEWIDGSWKTVMAMSDHEFTATFIVAQDVPVKDMERLFYEMKAGMGERA